MKQMGRNESPQGSEPPGAALGSGSRERIRILHLEDDPITSQLVCERLRRDGLEVEMDRVDTLPDFSHHLAARSHDLILSDFTIPGMETFDALRLAQNTRPDLPYVFFSGTLGEEAAVEALQRGATDYVLKDRPARLPSAVRRALREARQYSQRKSRPIDSLSLPPPLSTAPAPTAPPARSPWTRLSAARYAAAVLSVLVAWAIRTALDPYLQDFQPFAIFFASVLLMAWWAGMGPAILAAALGWLIGDYFFCYPRYTVIAGASPKEWSATVIYAALSVAVISLTQYLRRQGEQLKLHLAALQSAANAIMFTDPAGTIQWVNEAFTRLTGYTPAEAIGRNPRFLNSGKQGPAFFREMWDTLRAGRVWHGELINKRKDGSLYHEEMTITPVKESRGAPLRFIAIKQDVTERKRAEAALERRNLHLRLLQQASARLLGGQEPVQILRELHPQIAQVFGADAFLLYRPGNGRLQLEASGGFSAEQQQKLQTLRSGCAICARPAAALQTMVATHVQTREVPNRRFVRKLGLRSYLHHPLVINNRIHGTLAFASRRREDYDAVDQEFFATVARTLAEALERQRLQSELRHHASNLEHTVHERTAKLRETVTELEQMSYAMIHDLRAPLRVIHSFPTLVAEDPQNRLTGESRELLRKLQAAAERMDHLVRDVLNYARIVRREIPLQPVNVAALAADVIASHPQFRTSGVEVFIAPDLPAVLANPGALGQCLSQLLANAVRFARPGTKPVIAIKSEIAEAGFARLIVEDNGIGIAPELRERIFGLFNRLANTGEGTGMGLAIVRKAVERMGGRLGVDSQPGHGSRFWIELKLASTPSADTDERQA